MLTITLRKLERGGILIRHVSPAVSAQVEYEMSSLGKTFVSEMEALLEWLRLSSPMILEARRNASRKTSSLTTFFGL